MDHFSIVAIMHNTCLHKTQLDILLNEEIGMN